jgi:hypothetical protein
MAAEMNLHTPTRRSMRLGVMILAAACGGAETIAPPGPPPGPSTKIAPLTIRDSIQSVFATPLTITVTDSLGRAPRGVQVVVSAAYVGITVPPFMPAMLFAPPKEPSGVVSATVPTDSLGRVRLPIQAGFAPGPVRIRVSSPFGRDSLDGVVLPGHSHHFAPATRDTALFVGGTFTPSLVASDRLGNATGEAASLASRRPSVLDVSGTSVVARATGRVYVVATAGDARDSIGVSVVPPGNLIAFKYPYLTGASSGFLTFALDGSGYRSLSQEQVGLSAGSPQWSKALQRLIYHGSAPTRGNPYAVSLFSLPPTGPPSLVLSADVLAVGASAAQEYASASQPSVALDGSWIYFSASVGYYEIGIWRVRPNGTGASRVGPATAIGVNDLAPSVAPDGRRLVYSTDRGNFATGAMRLMLLDVTTGVSQFMATLGTHPSWSPVNDEIAFYWGELRIVKPDGTGEIVLAKGALREGQLAWSPDGKWIAACATGQFSGDQHIVLVERATGEVLPLAFTAKDKLCESTWKT